MIRYRVKLGVLVLLATLMVVLLFGSITFIWVRRETTRALAREIDARALHHAQSLALQTAEAILLEDRLFLKRLLQEMQSMDKEIIYIFLVDARGALIEHTFSDGFPAELLSANPLPVGRRYMVRRILDRHKRRAPIRDVVTPISDGFVGFAHIGLGEDFILASVRKVDQAVAGMVAVFVLFGLGASALFARMVSRPLETLAAAAAGMKLPVLPAADQALRGLPAGSFSQFGLETELDRLTLEFRRMVDRLAAAHQELRDAQEKLLFAERLSTIGTLAAGLAHELNNPLAGLKNCLRRIHREPDNRDQLQRYLTMMQASAERMETVLRGLLELARPRRPERKRFALEPFLERVVLLATPRFSAAGVNLRKEVQPGAAHAFADEHLLEQALLNLVLNAGDSLVERARMDPAFSPELHLRSFIRGRELCIEVRDNGRGIAPENLAYLFDPFFTTKSPGQGTGLGLSIAKDIVQAHGGEITVESRVGAGATFRIVLPGSLDKEVGPA